MNAKLYDDTDLSRPLTPSWREWLLRTQHMFQLASEPLDIRDAIIIWRDGSRSHIHRKHADAFCVGIDIESGRTTAKKLNLHDSMALEFAWQGALWIRDLNAGRSPAARYGTQK
jgi:hypothetical protein